MKEIGKMIKRMVKVFIHRMIRGMKVVGSMICSMVKVDLSGLMGHVTMENGSQILFTELAFFGGRMAVHIKASFNKV